MLDSRRDEPSPFSSLTCRQIPGCHMHVLSAFPERRARVCFGKVFTIGVHNLHTTTCIYRFRGCLGSGLPLRMTRRIALFGFTLPKHPRLAMSCPKSHQYTLAIHASICLRCLMRPVPLYMQQICGKVHAPAVHL